jgi:hypothetical protein
VCLGEKGDGGAELLGLKPLFLYVVLKSPTPLE